MKTAVHELGHVFVAAEYGAKGPVPICCYPPDGETHCTFLQVEPELDFADLGEQGILRYAVMNALAGHAAVALWETPTMQEHEAGAYLVDLYNHEMLFPQGYTDYDEATLKVLLAGGVSVDGIHDILRSLGPRLLRFIRQNDPVEIGRLDTVLCDLEPKQFTEVAIRQ